MSFKMVGDILSARNSLILPIANVTPKFGNTRGLLHTTFTGEKENEYFNPSISANGKVNFKFRVV